MSPDSLLLKVLVFIDRNGIVTYKAGNPFSARLDMKYENDSKKLKMQMSVAASPCGNGSCSSSIIHNNKTAFKANGCYTTSPFDSKIEVYKPGEWEDIIQ